MQQQRQPEAERSRRCSTGRYLGLQVVVVVVAVVRFISYCCLPTCLLSIFDSCDNIKTHHRQQSVSYTHLDVYKRQVVLKFPKF